MKKNIISMFFAICFMVWFLPVNAFAAEEVDWSTIKSAVEGAIHNNNNYGTDTSGEGWSYTHATATVTIAEGIKVNGNVDTFSSPSSPAKIENIYSNGGIFNGTIESGNFTGTVINEGTINGGTFNGEVTNNNTITNGTFNGTVTNGFGRYIYGGTFTNAVINDGRIYGGTFTNAVTNDSYIHDGTFEGTVTNMSFIVGGTFNGAVTSENSSHITDGTFTDTVTNEGIISGGTFTDTVTNEGIISKGTFNIIVNKVNGLVGSAPDVTYNKLINEGNTPNPNPGDEGVQQPTPQPGDNNNQNTSENTEKYTHTHNFQWTVIEEATEKVDGLTALMCEGCGQIEATQSISLYNNVIYNVTKDIKNAPENGTVIIENEFLRCFSDEMVEDILARPDVTVIVNFTDKGVNYSFTIPAGKAPTDGQEWYGYYYLGSVYGWTLIENVM